MQAEALAAEFAAGATPVEICVRTIRAIADAGVRHVYISNLPIVRTKATLDEILERLEILSLVWPQREAPSPEPVCCQRCNPVGVRT